MEAQDDSSAAGSPRCFDCFRPAKLCYCDSIPHVDNRTEVLILQHRRERFHPFNTARIVHRGLQRCRLLADHNRVLAERFSDLDLSDKVGLLYPSDNAPVLEQLPVEQRPDQLVVIDGTWHHAKSLMRDIPRLHAVPQYRLAPSKPGQYRIRREPNEHALSTIEATVSALQTLEPETVGLDQLLRAFHRMIADQLGHSDNTHWRQNRRRRSGSTNIPKALSGDLRNVVVAYGEQQPGPDSRYSNSDRRAPIYWVARRLGSGERFRCAIEPGRELGEKNLRSMRLTRADFDNAASIPAFRQRWQRFLRPADCLAVYHSTTARALRSIEADFVPTLILKSINLRQPSGTGTLEEILSSGGIQPATAETSRALQRLSNAVAYIQLLNKQQAA